MRIAILVTSVVMAMPVLACVWFKKCGAVIMCSNWTVCHDDRVEVIDKKCRPDCQLRPGQRHEENRLTAEQRANFIAGELPDKRMQRLVFGQRPRPSEPAITAEHPGTQETRGLGNGQRHQKRSAYAQLYGQPRDAPPST